MDSSVYFSAVPSYDTDLVCGKVAELFDQMPLCNTWNQDTKVLIKPNLLSKSDPNKAITTHPEVVRGVVRACVAHGVAKENITIADSAGGLYNTKQTISLYQGTGMTKIAQEEGVSLYTDCKSEVVPLEGKVVTSFNILKPALEADVIINLPKFKTHMMTGMTAGIKNMFGVIPGLEKSQWHTRFPDRLPFGEMLVDLYEKIPPTISLLDGILAMEGDGPGSGTPRELGILMASENTLHLDLAVGTMMGLQPMVVPYLQAANLRGLCATEFDMAWAKGQPELCAPIPNWVLPKSYENGKEGSVRFSQFLPKPLQSAGVKMEAILAPKPVIREKDCISCKKCSEICSKDAIIFEHDKARIIPKSCIRCFCCHEVCPVKAIDVKCWKIFQK